MTATAAAAAAAAANKHNVNSCLLKAVAHHLNSTFI